MDRIDVDLSPQADSLVVRTPLVGIHSKSVDFMICHQNCDERRRGITRSRILISLADIALVMGHVINLFHKCILYNFLP